jgi:NAD(P)-dependent dehydrogenase (short-subunit alcohol dehydrogenase family)
MGNPIALVTGASSGIGLATVVELAKAGYDVLATMRNPERQDQLISQAKQAKVLHQIEVWQLDVTDPEMVKRVANDVEEKFERLDLLLNNAGIAVTGVTEEIVMEKWQKQLETNCFGVVTVVQAFLPLMRQNRQGCIINISSGAAFLGAPYKAPYTASKCALEGFSESLRLELAPLGIKVVLVEPGFFQTNILKEQPFIRESSPYYEDARKVQSFIDRFSSKAKDPRQVAKKIVQIAQSRSPKMRYIVGNDARSLYLIKRFVPFRLIDFYFRSIRRSSSSRSS